MAACCSGGPSRAEVIEQIYGILEEAAGALRGHIELIDKLMLEMEEKGLELDSVKTQLGKSSAAATAEAHRKMQELRKEREALVSKVKPSA
mmetsp:Transcript_7054/g.8099  ORF Transcript_7054/g.8099 Transcript_7054/m.8099 type:complete len:91 (-) Transcript_7054:734-1006(-)|eukprot:CAMPEP_0197848228 /NCGR_PEP_ID=MMETSP1438-20131217/7993_1 /TAXON_ID=1461541 /ORGANISM="Pterosperma sp., Strain CCMP1384" /LENGTH=90 /DNA_ID=CAMNT_0043460371 /DNA_START=93 /DNA_END=365 /DNA_ORIENTATION=-